MSSITTFHMQNLTLLWATNASHAIPYAGPGSQCLTCDFLCWYRFSVLHMKTFMLVKVPDASDENPYAFPDRQHFTHNSLCWSRFPMLHMQNITDLRFIPCHLRPGNPS
ncbi:hypothetical protein O181_015935 [Austropuccinia psidii MF-1]|uniref:Uncharacterized protein n=1 Tax=Austropuccinia psidii MF-1 TaxID=1389203 RepID=A0A9Q3C4U3_9BASI|nr:hypothetical protein [Austropuccinia psidii MF-1]